MTDTQDNARLDAAILKRDAAPYDPRPPEFSEEALALEFAAANSDTLRYVAAWSRWMVWQDTHWRGDETRAALDLARPFCRRAAAACNWDRMRRTLASARTVQAVLQLATSDRKLAATVAQWDADPWALNTPDGVVDLKTGEMRGHDPGDHMTKITAVGPSGSLTAIPRSARASAGAGLRPAASRPCLPAVGTAPSQTPEWNAGGAQRRLATDGSAAPVALERLKEESAPTHAAQQDTPGGAQRRLASDASAAPVALERSNKESLAARPSSSSAWLSFLARITNGDAELEAFLQRMAGYALTGDTSAQALFFLYGTGANGKSVFTSTLAGIMGGYQATAPIETFTQSHTDRHPTELAGLRGARLVTASETEDGRRWAEARIKALTGGEAIAARYMRQDFFEYVPQFKLVIAGNHKPGLRGVDEAIRRRFHLVPFEVTIPAEERDPQLAEKLKKEWPAILAWAIEGCLDWQRQGLNPPPAVTAATAAYLDAQDAVGAWADECCAEDADAFELTAELYASWTRWAGNAGEPAGNRKRFADALGARGMEQHRRKQGRGFLGFRLRPLHDPDQYWRR